MDESSRESSFKEVAYTLLEQMDVSKVIFCSFELVCLFVVKGCKPICPPALRFLTPQNWLV